MMHITEPTGTTERIAELKKAKVESLVSQVLQEVSDTPPWAYTYRERPDDLIEIRAAELEAVLRGVLQS